MTRTYRPYEYDYDTSYVGRTGMIENYLDKKFANIGVDENKIKEVIENSVESSLGNIDCKFCAVHKHIEKSKDEIIEAQGSSCNCNGVTKKDITDAIEKINSHVDEKFDEIDFMKQFSDLNEQITQINNKN